MSQEEANRLISTIPEIETESMQDGDLREQTYKKSIRSLDSHEWAKMIKDLHSRIDERRQDGEKPIQMDEKYMDIAEGYLYGELSIALGVPVEEVKYYIIGKVHASETG